MTTRTVRFRINGEEVVLTVEDRTLACDLIRDHLGLTGTHVGCEQGVCGACTILVDGTSRRSCLMYAPQLHGRTVRTVEGLSRPGDDLHPLQSSFSRNHGLQCGFCTPGMLMTAYEYLEEHRDITDEDARLAMSGNVCRCTGYVGIVAAVREADREWVR